MRPTEPRAGRRAAGLALTAALAVTVATTVAGCATTPLTPLPRGPVSSGPGVSTIPAPRAGSRGDARLVRTIDSLLDQPAFRTATWGALVLGPRGDTLYARNAEKLLVPASNMKVVTAAVALARLGPDYRFRDTAVALPLRDTVPQDFGAMYDTAYVRDHPLRDVLPKMLKPSQNRLAEQLFETLALEVTGVVSRDSAAEVVRQQLAAWGIPADGYVVRDGSGFDRGDYLSPETITRVLLAARRDTAFAVFYDALPIAGVDGTLSSRLRATIVERAVHAKTGSLQSVRALSGYYTPPSGGEPITFSIVCNGFTAPPALVTGTMDRVVTLIAESRAAVGGTVGGTP